VGDPLGGLLLQSEDYSFDSFNSQVARMDGATGLVSWVYGASTFLYHDWARNACLRSATD